LQAYKKGAFNYIKEGSPSSGQAASRKYFSGGEVMIIPLRRDGRPTDVQVDGRSSM